MKLACALLLVLACGCAKNDGRVAIVGDAVLTKDDVAVWSARTGKREEALAELMKTALLAEGAKMRGLDRGAVKARADAARRQVLAQALLDAAVAERTGEPELHRRYDEKKGTLGRERIHVAHIVIREGPGAAEKLSLVLARLRAGELFAEVAKDLSEDAASAARGGELPPIDKGATDQTFFQAARKLSAGETSASIRTPFGIHVLQALKDPERVTPTFEQARGRLEAEASEEARTALVRQLEEDILVRLFAEGAK